jgi:VWFA-related protein
MGRKLQQSRQVVAEFVKTANPKDEFFVVQFGDRPVLLSGFSSNADEIQNQLVFVQAKGRSALLDAMHMALHQMRRAGNSRKALLVVSDGGDNTSECSISEIKALVQETGVQVYPIGLYQSLPVRERTKEELAGPGQLNEIAEQSGGRHFTLDAPAELPNVIAQLRTVLR